MIPFTIITLAVAGAGAFLLTRVLRNFQPGNRKIQADLREMKADMDKWSGDLVPLTREEMELFSLRQTEQSVRKRVTTTAKGVFTSIYHEPVLAYSYKQYAGKGRHALLYARTRNHEFAFWVRPKGVQVVIDNELAGTLKENGVLYDPHQKKMLARLNRETPEMLPVLVNDREVASLTKALPPAEKDIGVRAFQFVKEDLSQEEHNLLMALATFELVERTLKKE